MKSSRLTSFVSEMFLRRLIVFLIGTCLAQSCKVPCTKETTPTFFSFNGHTYTFHNSPKNWSEAYDICKNEGGYLAILESKPEIEFINKAIFTKNSKTTPYDALWIGGKYVNKTWQWPMNGYNVLNYPQKCCDPGEEDSCLILDPSAATKLSSLRCERFRRFICEQGCFALSDSDKTAIWQPEQCVLDPKMLDKCTLVCPNKEKHKIICSGKDWKYCNGNELTSIPTCGKTTARHNLPKSVTTTYMPTTMITTTTTTWPNTTTSTIRLTTTTTTTTASPTTTTAATTTIISTTDRNVNKTKPSEPPNGCKPFQSTDRGDWYPSKCTNEISRFNQFCELRCHKHFSQHGSSKMECTKNGWVGTSGVTKEPSCLNVKELAIGVLKTIKKIFITKKGKLNFMFVLDESGSVERKRFEIEKLFAQIVTKNFKLSKNRVAGLVKFSTIGRISIPQTESNTCRFSEKVDNLSYDGGNTKINLALRSVINELSKYNRPTKTLIFLITDGESQEDAEAEAMALQKDGHILFCVGVGDYNGQELLRLASKNSDGDPYFEGISSFTEFELVNEELKKTMKVNKC